MDSLHIFLPESMFLSQFNPTEFHSCTGLQGTQEGVVRFMLGSDLYFVFLHWVSSDVFVHTNNGRNLYIMPQLQVD